MSFVHTSLASCAICRDDCSATAHNCPQCNRPVHPICGLPYEHDQEGFGQRVWCSVDGKCVFEEVLEQQAELVQPEMELQQVVVTQPGNSESASPIQKLWCAQGNHYCVDDQFVNRFGKRTKTCVPCLFTKKKIAKGKRLEQTGKYEQKEKKPHTYAINMQDGTCSCPAFLLGRFMICKHLVHKYPPIPHSTTFFHTIKLCTTPPFLSHPKLIQDEQQQFQHGEAIQPEPNIINSDPDNESVIGEDPSIADSNCKWDSSIETIKGILAMVKDQKEKKGDTRWLEKIMAGMKGSIEMVEKCKSLKHRRTAPKMWSKDNVHTMFYK